MATPTDPPGRRPAVFPLALLLAAPLTAWRLRVALGVRWDRALLLCSPLPAAALAAYGAASARAFLVRLLGSVRVLPPTARQAREEDFEANPLFRAAPALRGKMAWRQLGAFPTPVQRFSCACAAEAAGPADFWVKREDLSSSKYGGNKVRSLQYTLGSFEAYVEACQAGRGASRTPRLLTFGSGGSNQVVATKVHSHSIGIPSAAVEGYCPMPDEPELDNTLNYLSALSLPGSQSIYGQGFGAIWRALYPRRCDDAPRPWVMGPGGLCTPGVLGQAGGALELAEQIARGELPDPDGIVLAMGSTCTTAGLALGVAIARKLGMPAFRQPGFRIYGQPVHPAPMYMQKLFGALKSETMPMAIGRSMRDAAAQLAALGGPDVTEEAMAVLRSDVVISVDAAITGKYGAHSKTSRAAKEAYDRTADGPDGAPAMWLCGHFSAKSFALLLKLLREDDAAGRPRRRLVFWQTKSAVQPRGNSDEWQALVDQCRKASGLRKWLVVGGATGHPAKIGEPESAMVPAAGPDDYRGLMTTVL